MTIHEAKDKAAKKLKASSYIEYVEVYYDDLEKMEELWQEYAEIYAQSKWDEGCGAQRIVCFQEYMKIDCYDHSNKFETIDRECNAIKNAPKPEFK